MKKILFICRATVGRSQMAEGFYNFFAGQKLAMSAGVEDRGKKYNYHPTTDIIAAMKEEGIDISKQVIKVVTNDMVDRADRVIVLCSKDICPEYVRTSTKANFIHIEDPFGQSATKISEVRDRIKLVVLDALGSDSKTEIS